MHQTGAQAYQQTAKVVESPRQRESALLMKAAAGLQKVKAGAPAKATPWQPAPPAGAKSAAKAPSGK